MKVVSEWRGRSAREKLVSAVAAVAVLQLEVEVMAAATTTALQSTAEVAALRLSGCSASQMAASPPVALSENAKRQYDMWGRLQAMMFFLCHCAGREPLQTSSDTVGRRRRGHDVAVTAALWQAVSSWQQAFLSRRWMVRTAVGMFRGRDAFYCR